MALPRLYFLPTFRLYFVFSSKICIRGELSNKVGIYIASIGFLQLNKYLQKLQVSFQKVLYRSNSLNPIFYSGAARARAQETKAAGRRSRCTGAASAQPHAQASCPQAVTTLTVRSDATTLQFPGNLFTG